MALGLTRPPFKVPWWHCGIWLPVFILYYRDKTAHMRKDEMRMLYRGDLRSEFLSLAGVGV